MVARGRKRIGHAFEQILAVVFNEGCFAVHHPIIHDDVPAEDMSDALVAQTNA